MPWTTILAAVLGVTPPAVPADDDTDARRPSASRPRVVSRGRTIDLELQAVDVRAVFPTLGEIGRVNFVLGPGVEGKVTAFLEDVTWEEALYWICRAMHLRSRRSGNVIYVDQA